MSLLVHELQVILGWIELAVALPFHINVLLMTSNSPTMRNRRLAAIKLLSLSLRL
jgi:hypothetical protein